MVHACSLNTPPVVSLSASDFKQLHFEGSDRLRARAFSARSEHIRYVGRMLSACQHGLVFFATDVRLHAVMQFLKATFLLRGSLKASQRL